MAYSPEYRSGMKARRRTRPESCDGVSRYVRNKWTATQTMMSASTDPARLKTGSLFLVARCSSRLPSLSTVSFIGLPSALLFVPLFGSKPDGKKEAARVSSRTAGRVPCSRPADVPCLPCGGRPHNVNLLLTLMDRRPVNNLPARWHATCLIKHVGHREQQTCFSLEQGRQPKGTGKHESGWIDRALPILEQAARRSAGAEKDGNRTGRDKIAAGRYLHSGARCARRAGIPSGRYAALRHLRS